MPEPPADLDQQLAAAARAEALLTPEYFARLVDRSAIEYDPAGQPSNLRDLARRFRRDHPWWIDDGAGPVEAPRPIRRATTEGDEQARAYWLERTRAGREAAAEATAARKQPAPPAEFTAALERHAERRTQSHERADKVLASPEPVQPTTGQQVNEAMRRLAGGGGTFHEATRTFREQRRVGTVEAGRLPSRPEQEAP